MKVTVAEVKTEDRLLQGDYAIDPRFGLPLIGEELFLRTRDYHDTRFYVKAVIKNRRWIFSDNKPEDVELRLLVEVQP